MTFYSHTQYNFRSGRGIEQFCFGSALTDVRKGIGGKINVGDQSTWSKDRICTVWRYESS